MATGNQFGWLRVVPLWVGVMSGALGIAQQLALLYPPTQGDPFWQQKVFWACVWIAFVISMFAAWYLKHREATAEREKHLYPNIQGGLVKVFFGTFKDMDEIWELNSLIITVKVRLENHSPAPTNITDCRLDVNTDNGTFTMVKADVAGFTFRPDPRFDSSTNVENLSDISTRGNDEMLVRGRAEYWWFRGKLPPYDFTEEHPKNTKQDDVKEVVFWVTDGLGKRHQIKGVPPWNQTGEIVRPPPKVSHF